MIASAPIDSTARTPATLGGFALERRIGQGGMADVWLGHHRIEGQPAAIKVITRHMAEDERYREGLRQEVRAVAGLDHPNIVPVFDAGTVDAAAAAASNGALVAGSPWLAMHYAAHGELRRLPHPMPWPLLRDVLLQILDGLAHAHARGVVHRDLKPENVLLHIESDRLRLMLTDFGIAHVIDADQTDGGISANSAGTPHYMAPEQFQGRWRDYGPWTDLYALGCMAFELATGQPPFTDRNLFGIAQKHLTGEVPPLMSPETLPAGFEDWIRRMMRREPFERFQSAADAAWALGRLPAPDADAARAARLDALERLGVGVGEQATEISNPQGVALAETQGYAPSAAVGHTLAGVLIDAPRALPVRGLGDGPADAATDIPPMPDTWFVDTPERPLLRGVGLGLFGLRQLPFVDRDADRDALWAALRDVREKNHSRLVVLEGVEGSGKSRLARWFARRAAEVGAAQPITVRHSPMDAPGDALGAAVDAWFRGQGLQRPALEQRIAQRLTALDPERAEMIATVHAPALARFVRPEGERRHESHQLTPRERYGAVHGWLHALGRRRPVILVLDDVQWCDDSLALVQWMLSNGCPVPVLVVATLRSDLCGGNATATRVMAQLTDYPRAERRAIGPLAETDLRRTIGELLGLHPFLADQLLTRSAGNPLFAEQIIADWTEREALEPTEQGYMCNGTALVDVPPDLPTLAGRRVDRLAARFPEPAAVHTALEAAALLGQAVRIDEWQDVYAAVSGGPLPEGLQDALYDAGLARPDRGGWVFGHGFVREALKARARQSGRAGGLHRAAAGVVRGGQAPEERRARHLAFAGEIEAAIDALAEAARSRMDASEYVRVLAICDWRLSLIDEAGLAADDVRRAEALPMRIEALRYQGDFADAAAALKRFRSFPFGPDHPFLLAESERLRGGEAFTNGRVEDMSEAYRQAIDLYRVAGSASGEAKARHGLGWALIYYGLYSAAERAFVASHAVAARAGLRLDEAWGLHGIGAARMFSERPEAEGPLLAARAIFRELRSPVGLLGCRLFLAEVARQRGDLVAALAGVRSAIDIGRTVGSQLQHLARSIEAMILMDLGRPDEARVILDEIEHSDAFDRIQRQYGPSVRTGMARLAFESGELQRVAAIADEIEASRPKAFMHPRSRQTLVEIGEGLVALGEAAQAARWFALAAEFYERLDPERSATYAARARRLA